LQLEKYSRREVRKMTINLRTGVGIVLGLGLITPAWSQSGPAKDIGTGAGDVATGPVKATGSVAKGTAKGVGDAVTLHPIGAAKNVTKGAAGAGKDVTVGAAKGSGKIVRGVGKAVKGIF
jgi:hypothetical protein